jgi:carbamoyltransferase
MYILGLSCYYHDAAACLLKEGMLIAAAQEERFSGIKHDFSFPYNAIQFCLEQEGIAGEDVDYVVFHEKPFVKFERIIKSILATYPRSYNLFREVAVNWLKYKLWIKATIAGILSISEDKILFCEHHLSHAASTFFCSPFEQAAILTVDGVGEWATTTLGMGQGNWNGLPENKIKIIEEIRFPHSLGLLYSAFTAFLGFKVNNGEYKVMGMGAYGKPQYLDKVYQLINVNADGSFTLNMKYFSFQHSTRYSYNKNFIKLFGTPRPPESRFVVDKKSVLYNKSSISDDEINENKHFADIAASIQKVTEEVVVKIANNLYQKTGLKKLCMAGGVALNCVANYKVLKETPFDEIYIQPAAGDSGAALGAALYAWHCLLNKKREFVLTHSYWGKSYSNQEIKTVLGKEGIEYREYSNEEDMIEYVIGALTDQKIVGWFQGRFEWGPRALGNRSILADPRNPQMKDTLNLKIKFREPFRPFAPSVLSEGLDKLFDTNNVGVQYPPRFMLYTIPIKNNSIAAATHVDSTTRLQAVHRETNPLYYKLIEFFYKQTGVPALLNTSFNLKGEPIVNTPQDALSTFRRSGMDMLVMGNCVIEKNG